MDSAIWLIIAVVLAVIEASTAQLVCIWFSLGAVCALITSIFTDSITVQIIVFVLSSAIILALTRKIVIRLTKNKKEMTNSESLIGKVFVLCEDVNNDLGTGALKASGTTWSVRNTEEGIIPSGTKVVVEKIEGVKLFVKKAD